MNPPTSLREQLVRDESYRRFPYFDCCGKPFRECRCPKKGKLTIGIGWNLEDDGITLEEAEYFLDRKVPLYTAGVLAHIPFAHRLDEARRAVLVNLAFNMGIGDADSGLLGFRKMLAAMERSDWPEAARELLDSTYHRQVGIRAERLAEQIISGEWR